MKGRNDYYGRAGRKSVIRYRSCVIGRAKRYIGTSGE